jgi:hypothetical protein
MVSPWFNLHFLYVRWLHIFSYAYLQYVYNFCWGVWDFYWPFSIGCFLPLNSIGCFLPLNCKYFLPLYRLPFYSLHRNFCFSFLMGLGFELSALHLQGRCPTAGATPPVHFGLAILEMWFSQTICLGWPRTMILLISVF